jgi:hypothetical protein
MERSGFTIKQAQALARHSDPRLTLGRYAHANLTELSAALGKLPVLTTGADAPAALSKLLPPEAVEALLWAGLAFLAPALSSLDAPRVAPRTENAEDGTGRVGTEDAPERAAG